MLLFQLWIWFQIQTQIRIQIQIQTQIRSRSRSRIWIQIKINDDSTKMSASSIRNHQQSDRPSERPIDEPVVLLGLDYVTAAISVQLVPSTSFTPLTSRPALVELARPTLNLLAKVKYTAQSFVILCVIQKHKTTFISFGATALLTAMV